MRKTLRSRALIFKHVFTENRGRFEKVRVLLDFLQSSFGPSRQKFVPALCTQLFGSKLSRACANEITVQRGPHSFVTRGSHENVVLKLFGSPSLNWRVPSTPRGIASCTQGSKLLFAFHLTPPQTTTSCFVHVVQYVRRLIGAVETP